MKKIFYFVTRKFNFFTPETENEFFSVDRLIFNLSFVESIFISPRRKTKPKTSETST